MLDIHCSRARVLGKRLGKGGKGAFPGVNDS